MHDDTVFSQHNFATLCYRLAEQDADLKAIIDQYGLPPMWNRKPNFETLVHIILEQQVSLASALAALRKLQERIGVITPQKLLALSDAELRACYFSRQKTTYVRCLAAVVQNKQLKLAQLANLSNEQVHQQLTAIKGIGQWTTDVYLMMALQRGDLFPTGDIALINSIKTVKRLPKETSKEKIVTIAENWRPWRTLGAFLLWHDYLSKQKKQELAT